MSLPGEILFILGIICTIVGIVAKIFSINVIDGATLILLGILSVTIAIGGFSINDVRQSRKRKIFDWMLFFFLILSGIFSYLKD